MTTAEQIIKKLNLTPHVEKGYYIQTFIDPEKDSEGNAYSTAIYYLLQKHDEKSNWHRVLNAVEIWHYYAGAPIRLSLSWNNGAPIRQKILGSDVMNDEEPQVLVQRGEWQSAETLGDWTLVGCTVSPAFAMKHFEMKDKGWQPQVD
ncbi:cupin family protein [Periconia macrospinosa]|uniref:Cupin family protein n=1 Tax=Periconia macrospinosa TaxID=97972 RepID=A0A2V1E4Z3_9PLEO|nr:cupin family protein [Periconia macrospinosa]